MAQTQPHFLLRSKRLMSRDEMDRDIRKIAFVADYLPRKCGIATFTYDLRTAVAEAFPDVRCIVVAVNDNKEGYAYSGDVMFEIEEQEQLSYLRAADYINTSGVDIVCVQHEYGIFGGNCGSMLLPFLKALRVPIVCTLHTILEKPSKEQHRITHAILQLSARVITMADKGRNLLRSVYGASTSKVEIIPHGIPSMEFPDTETHKATLGLSGHRVVLTFGLLSPNKGIEFAIRAMAGVVAQFPDVLYVILGQTHPALIRENGESYRNGLRWIVKDLGIGDNITFVNQFVDMPLLKQYIAACDVYLTPYLHEQQITSGTLSYSFGMGTAVVSTPYWHASELLAGGQGTLVPFRDSEAITTALCQLLKDDRRRMEMKQAAFRVGREMTWPNIAKMYHSVFETSVMERIVQTPFEVKPESTLPELKADHLLRLTDATGIAGNATFTIPNYSSGYSVDDNARALLFIARLRGARFQWTFQLERLQTTYCAFLTFALDMQNKRFKNSLSYSREWKQQIGSEDCHGRALWALGACARFGVHMDWARSLFEETLPPAVGFSSPRAMSFALLGLRDFLIAFPKHGYALEARTTLANNLFSLLKACSTAGQGDDEWIWFEDELSHDNATLPAALIASGSATGNSEWRQAGLDALDWLMAKQLSVDGTLVPITCDVWKKGQPPKTVETQQPLEAGGAVLACMEAAAATESEGSEGWKELARASFEWFMGRNLAGTALYSHISGGCGDALHRGTVNQNQGAESLISFLLALVELRAEQSRNNFTMPMIISTFAGVCM